MAQLEPPMLIGIRSRAINITIPHLFPRHPHFRNTGNALAQVGTSCFPLGNCR